MEIHGTIPLQLSLPHFPAFSRSRCQRLFAAVHRNVTAALSPPWLSLLGADGTCLRTRMNKINGSEEKNDVSSNFE